GGGRAGDDRRTGGGRPGRPGGAAKFGAGKQAPGRSKPGDGRTAKPFANERFGKDVKPVGKTPRTHAPKHRGSATPPPSGPLARPERLHSKDGERLQKIMAHAGVASRRVCEEMIEAGRVEVDGQIVRELGIRVDPQRSTIHVDGIRIQVDETLRYLVFNKPAGVVSTMDDPEGRPAISNFLRETPERLFHVGRLDVSTEGLLLLTNDGELANRLTHPSYEVPKTYLVQVRGPLPKGIGAQMKAGIELEDGLASVDSFRLVDSTPGHVLIEVVLHSGRNRIVRRLFDAVGFPVLRLVRVKLGPIALGDQKQGSIRALGRQEAGVLLASVGL
ncbi:pseudouridine synthase, partial [Tersicoccus solisilvae]|uniref:pseudouridine synthase n=1 Tax=Tersicoccus solisilvae TaxID=1882339 RepID=UPI00166340F6